MGMFDTLLFYGECPLVCAHGHPVLLDDAGADCQSDYQSAPASSRHSLGESAEGHDRSGVRLIDALGLEAEIQSAPCGLAAFASLPAAAIGFPGPLFRVACRDLLKDSGLELPIPATPSLDVRFRG